MDVLCSTTMQIEYSKWRMESFRKRFIQGANAIMQSEQGSLYIVFDLSFLKKFLLSFQLSWIVEAEYYVKNILFNNTLEFQG